MGNLRIIAEARWKDPMNTWPDHLDFHRRNTHPFSGSRYGELQWDEECLRCQLEKVSEEKARELPHQKVKEEEESGTRSKP